MLNDVLPTQVGPSSIIRVCGSFLFKGGMVSDVLTTRIELIKIRKQVKGLDFVRFSHLKQDRHSEKLRDQMMSSLLP